MTADNPYAVPERFAVSHKGMQQIHAGRHPWQLLKELIQNVWDEAPPATICEVDICPAPTGEDMLRIRVADDGPGFANIADAWTLMGPTPKRHDPAKRGRFNMGEKELVSVAIEADIETVGHTVHFPRIGGRLTAPNHRQRGTIITALMPWPRDQADELVRRIKRFRPNGCGLTVNGEQVPERQPELVRAVTLTTVTHHRETGALRHSPRKTEIHLLPPAGKECWLYEMGIPIQPITADWDIDVQQKVPMPPNRDTVPEYYLTDIYAEALNAAHEIMAADRFAEQWVRNAMEDPRVETGAVQSVLKGRYGDHVLLSSSVKDSNMHATEGGYELVNPKSLSPTERPRFQQDAGLKTAHDAFGRREAPTHPVPTENLPRYAAFAAWAKQQAAHCGLNANIEFIESPQAATIADCTAMTKNPTIRFNTAHPSLTRAFFQPPFGRADQLELLIHELGHALADKPSDHGPAWGRGVAKAGARIAAVIAPTRNDHGGQNAA